MTEGVKQTILFVLTAAVVPLLEALVKADLAQVLADPRPWGLGLATAMVRAAASAMLARLLVKPTPHG